MIYVFTFLLAFCSIVYELLLGQSLSAFLGNTVLRYSVTIGLYMLSMGIGSLLAEGRVVKHVVTSLLKVEILLTITGGFSVILLLVMNSIGPPDIVFFLFAHLLIVLIGILTGLEIPLLIELRNLEVDNSERSVLGIDYLGAFFGTVVFAFLFYPSVGLIPTAFMVALLNAFVGICLVTQWPKVHEGQRRTTSALLGVQVVLFAVLALLLRSADAVNETFLNIYLGL
jgi:spermidine synthase